MSDEEDPDLLAIAHFLGRPTPAERKESMTLEEWWAEAMNEAIMSAVKATAMFLECQNPEVSREKKLEWIAGWLLEELYEARQDAKGARETIERLKGMPGYPRSSFDW